MEKKSNMNIIVAIVIILAVVGVGIAIKFSGASTDSKSTSKTTETTTEDQDNPASKIEAPEIKITDANFEQEIKNYKGVAMVDMFSPTCPHCQNMGPIVTSIAKSTEGKYRIGKLNAIENETTANNFKIESVPAFIFFKDGNEVKRLVGEQEESKILSTLDEVAASK